jgi:CRP/FNR family transcriptional regulator, anaerobic regulatory protein
MIDADQALPRSGHDHRAMTSATSKCAALSARSHVACAACALRKFCVTGTADGIDAEPANRRRLREGDALFRKGDRHTALFAVRAGFLKTCSVLPNGERRILAYHIMGDVLGLDALHSGVHPTEVVALNGCEVCEIGLERAEGLMSARSAVAAHLRALLSEQIARAGDHMVALGALSAPQRVAGFLLDLGARWALRGYSATEFDLCLTRKEIGSYLGLTFETVSRMLSRFDAREWISVAGRGIRIRDHGALQAQFAGE